MTVGFYAPLAPARTGVADYATALLAELRRHGCIAVAPGNAAPEKCDVALYHLGNNPLHAAIYQRALERPGVVVLHDAVLHHFFLGQLDEAAYAEEFVYNYGEWNRDLARELWRGRAASVSENQYFVYPMVRRLRERSLAIVVHNPAAAALVAQHAGNARIVEIPHLFPHSFEDALRPAEAVVLRYRQGLGIDPGVFLFGVFGYLRESKRLLHILETFANLRRRLPPAALLVAGEFVSGEFERAASPLLASTGVVRLPYSKEREFRLASWAVDAAINLRSPAAGESSGITIRLMGLGKPVMVTDSLECARFPEDACMRIPAGVAERESLAEHMLALAAIPEAARSIGLRAAAHIHAHHQLEKIAGQYWELLCEFRR